MDWEHWVGEVIDAKYPLHRFVEGGDVHGVFVTGFSGGRQLQKAIIRLFIVTGEERRAVIARWSGTAALSHDNLVDVIATGETQHDGSILVYMVSEFPDESLAEVIPDRALTPDEAKEFLEPTLDVLAYLHGKGYAHGGVQPTNLFAVQESLKIARESIRPIGDGIAPSPYAAPESSAQGATPAADMWALGLTLVEVLTQRRPQDAPDADELAAELPAPFSSIVRNCLAADPNQRWTAPRAAAVLSGTSAEGENDRRPFSFAKTVRVGLFALVGVVLAGVVVRPWLFSEDGTGGTPLSKQEPASKQDPRPEPAKSEPTSKGKKADMVKAAKSEPPSLPPEPASLPPEPKKPAKQADKQLEKAAKPEPKKPDAKHEEPARPPTPEKETRPAPSGDVVKQVLPEVRPDARRTIRGKVAVGIRVNVNGAGEVVNAAIDSRGPSWYFADLALDAAKRWRFAPSSGDAPRQWILQFEFQRASTKAAARRATPKP